MPFDETLGLAQILLALLLFTVGIPALIIEIRVDESLRRLLHKRMHPVPLLVLGSVTLSIVLALFLVTGQAVSLSTERLLRLLSAGVIVLFAAVWYYIYNNLRISAVVREVVDHMKARLNHDGTISSPDLSDLLTAGENLEGHEKTEILVAVGELIQLAQHRHEYSGTRLEALIRGLPRIVERNGSIEHHNAAMRVVTQSWTELVTKKLKNEKDADFILNAASG